jgi:hypothetical protein
MGDGIVRGIVCRYCCGFGFIPIAGGTRGPDGEPLERIIVPCTNPECPTDPRGEDGRAE